MNRESRYWLTFFSPVFSESSYLYGRHNRIWAVSYKAAWSHRCFYLPFPYLKIPCLYLWWLVLEMESRCWNYYCTTTSMDLFRHLYLKHTWGVSLYKTVVPVLISSRGLLSLYSSGMGFIENWDNSIIADSFVNSEKLHLFQDLIVMLCVFYC